MSVMARQYRLGDTGARDWGDVICAVRVLEKMRFAMEGEALEKRLAEVEAMLAEADLPPPRLNGGSHVHQRH